MSSWRKPARLAVGIFGVVFAVVVYLAFGTRDVTAPPGIVERLDPRAVIESTAALLQQVRETQQDFEVKAARTLTYEDGSTKQFEVRITVRNRSGRDFVVTTREAQAGANQREIQLSGDVKVTASDGFELATGSATFNQDDGIVRAPGEVSFSKGRMKGSGLGMTYDKNSEVLIVLDQSDVTLTAANGATEMSFGGRTASLDRVQDFVKLDGGSHVVRGEQTLDSETATARLSADEQFVTLIELRGQSRVTGGDGSFDSMAARDIDMDYTDDGKVLERVVLIGTAAVALSSTRAEAGRQLKGETLELKVAPDGSITHASGRERVRLDMPATENGPARSIASRTLDASGEAGAGLTSARFLDEVEYRELANRERSPRVVRSRALSVDLDENDVRNAVFTGGVTFEDRGLTAAAGEARYDPERGTLNLIAGDASGSPRVTDEQFTVTAPTIDVALQTRRIDARGGIKTTIAPKDPKEDGAAKEGAKTLPGLLQQDRAANVNADNLTYEGSSGKATYSGNATLWQGETAIRGDVLDIDQENGDLQATGSARSTLALDGAQSIGRAREIRYRNRERSLTFDSSFAAAARGQAPGGVTTNRAGTPPIRSPSQLTGPQGDLRADRIEMQLASENGRARRLDAFSNVNLKVDTRTATGARLTYHADDERYILTGTATAPVRVVESCRETVGKTLTFFKSTDRILVDGNEEIRTQTKGGGPCPQPPAR